MRLQNQGLQRILIITTVEIGILQVKRFFA